MPERFIRVTLLSRAVQCADESRDVIGVDFGGNCAARRYHLASRRSNLERFHRLTLVRMVEIVECDIRAVEGERLARAAVDELKAQLHEGKGRVPAVECIDLRVRIIRGQEVNGAEGRAAVLVAAPLTVAKPLQAV